MMDKQNRRDAGTEEKESSKMTASTEEEQSRKEPAGTEEEQGHKEPAGTEEERGHKEHAGMEEEQGHKEHTGTEEEQGHKGPAGKGKKQSRKTAGTEEKQSRKEKAAATKEKIFTTAAGLIKWKGYANVTVSEICECAGIAKGSFYVHYRSKEDIIRESYYSDLGEYIARRYAAFLDEHPESTGGQRILRFLQLELEFAEHAGYELTCLAYSLNLAACVPGPSEHQQKRLFSRTLYQEIAAHMDEARTDLSAADVFTYLESVVRGIMATWCFSNHGFHMEDAGAEYLTLAVGGLFPL